MNPYPDCTDLHDAVQNEFVQACDAMDLGNDLLIRAKEVSQKIEERVRALCSEHLDRSA